MTYQKKKIEYKDDGCHLHDSCLTCPEIVCVFDFPGYEKGWRNFKSIVELQSQGLTIEEIAVKLGKRRKQIEAWLKASESLVLV